MKYDNQLRYASNIINQYDGLVPLSSWLKDFFKKNKQMGSRDRKTVSELVYGFYRLGHHPFEKTEDRIIAGIHLLNNLPELLDYFKPSPPVIEKGKIFPWTPHLSTGMDADRFIDSFLQQPHLFIRIRPGFDKAVATKLKDASVPYTQIEHHCIALPNSTKTEGLLDINKEAVIQDISSQHCGVFFPMIPFPVKKVWDCCAGGGGKAIMAFDLIKNISLTVSDKRKIIIGHLMERFKEAGISDYTPVVADLIKEGSSLPANQSFDLVIADVPCTGSGTWSRTPEQLCFFKEDRIAYYKNLQEKIVTRVLPSIKSAGALLYITCSVFREENEQMVDFILTSSSLRLIKMELIKGYENRADTMFAALFTT